MSAVLESILQEVKALSESERQQLLDVLNAAESTPSQHEREQQLLRELEARGILTLPKQRLQPLDPVDCSGQPVSELLIQERR